MKNKIKCISIMVLISVVVICVIRMLKDNDAENEPSNVDKGSYSYYYSEPAMTTEEASDGISFYGK